MSDGLDGAGDPREVEPRFAEMADRVFGGAMNDAQALVSARFALAIAAADRAGYERGRRDSGAHAGDLASALRNVLDRCAEVDGHVTDARACMERVQSLDEGEGRGTSTYVPDPADETLAECGSFLERHARKRVRLIDERDADDADRREAMGLTDNAIDEIKSSVGMIRRLAETLLSRVAPPRE